MDLKLFLNKYAKVDNIELYTLKSIYSIRDCYNDLLDKTDGQDPDFPMVTFGEGRGKKVKGRNANEERIEIGEEPVEDPLLY